jgi:hypothetical protein
MCAGVENTIEFVQNGSESLGFGLEFLYGTKLKSYKSAGPKFVGKNGFVIGSLL